MVIREAGESCAFYIADRLGTPSEMFRVAIRAAYGEDAVESYVFENKGREIKKTIILCFTKPQKGTKISR